MNIYGIVVNEARVVEILTSLIRLECSLEVSFLIPHFKKLKSLNPIIKINDFLLYQHFIKQASSNEKLNYISIYFYIYNL